MQLNFTKMHGIGNDFVVIDGVNQSVQLSPEQCRFIANRRIGVGCDQILLVEASDQSDVDFRYRIFNADGSEVAQCGNGARCFLRFVLEKGLSDKQSIRVKTRSGILELYQESDDQVRVSMGEPIFEPAGVPFLADSTELSYTLNVDGESVPVGVVSVGNPHAVVQVDNVQTAQIARLGPKIESHPSFPEQVNAGFMQIISPDHIRLRVYERGAGETLACGSGACAAVAVGHIQGLLSDCVKVSLPGGDLVISWQGVKQPIWMTGPAATVYEGSIEL